MRILFPRATREQRLRAFRSGHFAVDRDSAQAQGLVGWWPLGWGPTEKDFSVFKNHGTRVGTPPRTPMAVPGWGPIPVLEHDGSTQYTDLVSTTTGILDFTSGPFSLSARVYRRTFNNEETIIGKRDGGGFQYQFRISSNKMNLLRSGGSVVATSNVGVDEHHHCVASVASDGSGNFYLDATNDGSFVTKTITHKTTDVVIGHSPGAGSWQWDGFLADVRAYNRELSASDVESVYNEPWRLVVPIGVRTISFASQSISQTYFGEPSLGVFESPVISKFN